MFKFLWLFLLSNKFTKSCPLIPFIKKITQDGLMIVKFDRDISDITDHELELFLEISL